MAKMKVEGTRASRGTHFTHADILHLYFSYQTPSATSNVQNGPLVLADVDVAWLRQARRRLPTFIAHHNGKSIGTSQNPRAKVPGFMIFFRPKPSFGPTVRVVDAKPRKAACLLGSAFEENFNLHFTLNRIVRGVFQHKLVPT